MVAGASFSGKIGSRERLCSRHLLTFQRKFDGYKRSKPFCLGFARSHPSVLYTWATPTTFVKRRLFFSYSLFFRFLRFIRSCQKLHYSCRTNTSVSIARFNLPSRTDNFYTYIFFIPFPLHLFSSNFFLYPFSTRISRSKSASNVGRNFFLGPFLGIGVSLLVI